MGRELKRVPIDFDWPLKKTWKGYLNPIKYPRCPDCDGTGYSRQAKMLQDIWYGWLPFHPLMNGCLPWSPDHPAIRARAESNYATEPERKSEAERLAEHFNSGWCHNLNQSDVDALLKADRLWDFTRVPRTQRQRDLVAKRVATGKHNSWLPYDNRYRPTAQEVNEWSLAGLGHDSLNAGICIDARCKANKWPSRCPKCKGNGVVWPSKQAEKEYEAWEREEPPKGDGYQLWETTSEGSPISPVFSTLDELCAYAAEHCTTFGSSKASAEDWKQMLGDGLVCHREGNMIFL